MTQSMSTVTPSSPSSPARNSPGKVSSASPKSTETKAGENAHGDDKTQQENKRGEQEQPVLLLNKKDKSREESPVGSRETSSPSIDFVGDLGRNASHITFRQGTKREVEVEVNEAILPDILMGEVNETEKGVEERGVIVRRGGDEVEEEDEEGDEENRLVIDVPGEQDERGRKKDEDKEGLEKDKEMMRPPKQPEPLGGRGGEEAANGNEEDFQCSQCQQVFTCDEDLQTHFSEEHVRLAHSAIIQEPESPFPVVTVRGTSSIFEDEVEESEPYPVGGGEKEGGNEAVELTEVQLRLQAQQRVAQGVFPAATLSSLLAGRVGGGGGFEAPGSRVGETAERLLVEPLITSYMHEIQGGRPTAIQGPQGSPVQRHSFPGKLFLN